MGGGEDFKENEYKLRFATKADLDDITDVARSGFPDDPEFDYRFPYRDKYPEDNRKWIHREYEQYLEQPKKFATLVVTTPVSRKGISKERAISVGIWDISPMSKSTGGDLGLDTRRDVNRAHFEELAKKLKYGFEHYFSKYGQEQYHLWLLVTHPGFRRRGAATRLCRWGMDSAIEKGYISTVLGSPMGTVLYKQLGFICLGSVTVQVDGEDEHFDFYCLEYLKKK